MSSQVSVHLATRPSFYRPQAACLIRDALRVLRFPNVDATVPTASPLVGSLHMTRPRHKPTASSLQKTGHDFLPLPVLSSSSHCRLCAGLTFGVQKGVRRPSALVFRFICAGVSGISDYQAFWLFLYFVLNLVLTLYNKVLLVSFPYPYTLTAIHTLFGLAGSTFLRLRKVYEPRSLCGSDHVVIVTFSILYSVNIAISNASLGLVTVPFHQVVRAATPFFTTVFSWYLFNTHFNRYQILSTVVVVFGVGLSTYGDYYFTTCGFTLTLIGAVLAALKTIMTHKIQTSPLVSQPFVTHSKSSFASIPIGPVTKILALLPRLRCHRLQLHPLDLLTHLSRLAVVQCIAYAYLFGEVDLVFRRSSYSSISWQIVLISGNGVVACALNIVSFEANRRSGALSMGVAANVKQVLTILCAVWFFHLNLSPLNVLGIVLTLLGGAWYTMVEYCIRHGYFRS